MNILAGVIAPDRGEVRVDGAAVRFANPRDAQASGIATIFQELDLVPGLDITANLFLGRELMRPGGRLDNARMEREARNRMESAGVDIDVRRRVQELSIGQRQLVAIAKALSYASRVLVMDEPTAALSATEAERLFKVVRAMRERGVGIVYISHRLEEVPRVADRVTVLRDGRRVGEEPATAPQAQLVRLLVGRPFDELFPPRAGALGPELLRLDHARFAPRRTLAGWQAPMDVSLTVHAREIVGLAGVMGAGRTELLLALYGAGPRGRWEGTIEASGKPSRLATIAAARRAGLAFVTDDRRGSGLILRHSVGRNVVMSILRRISPFGFMSGAAEEEAAERSIKTFDIRPPRAAIPVGNLSGGNQQKVVFAKELLQRAAPAAARRADPRRRRRRQRRNLPAPARAHQSGPRRSRGFERAARIDRALRQDHRHAAGMQHCRISGRRRRARSFGERDRRRRGGGMTEAAKENLPQAAAPIAKARDPLALVVRFQSVIGLVLVLIGGVVFSPSRHGQILFLSPDNIANIIRAISETGIIALGMTFVIITAGIDLSVGAMLGLNSVLTAMLMTTTISASCRLCSSCCWLGRRSGRCRA